MSRRWPGGGRQIGFTIVEFMIATSVFGVVILGVSAAIVAITRSYQHSLYTSQTQAATGNLVDTVAQAVKFSNSSVMTTGDPLNGTGSLCIGTRQFLYVLGKQLDGSNPDTTTRNAVMTRLKPDSSCNPESITSSAPSGEPKELLGKSMRLAKFSVVPEGAMWRITARVVYGDDDLLCSPNKVEGSCTSADTLSQAQMSQSEVLADLSCKPQRGSEFCAVSELSTTVYRRL